MLSLPLAGELPIEIPPYTGNMEVDLLRMGRARLAERITGGLSSPGKMPCPAWGISALRCKIGSTLAKQEGTTCRGCYALKGNYRHKKVQEKLELRYKGLFSPDWTPAMVFLINYFCDEYFRWFDSGDLLCGRPDNRSPVAEN